MTHKNKKMTIEKGVTNRFSYINAVRICLYNAAIYREYAKSDQKIFKVPIPSAEAFHIFDKVIGKSAQLSAACFGIELAIKCIILVQLFDPKKEEIEYVLLRNHLLSELLEYQAFPENHKETITKYCGCGTWCDFLYKLSLFDNVFTHARYYHESFLKNKNLSPSDANLFFMDFLEVIFNIAYKEVEYLVNMIG